MKLFLIRHAKTNPRSETGKDSDRALLPRGIRQSEDLKIYITEAGIAPKKVLCSTARRTKETLAILDISAPVEYLEDLYLSPPDDMLRIVNSQSVKGDLMLVGHNEGISELASYLTGQELHLQTGTLIALQFEGDSWMELSGGMASIVHRYRSTTN